MSYWYVAEVNSRKLVFGQGNTRRTAEAAGEWNARENAATNERIVRAETAPYPWYDALPQPAG